MLLPSSQSIQIKTCGECIHLVGVCHEGSGGDEGIRTLDGLMTHTPLAGERLRPLGHVSVGGTSDFA